MSTTSLTSSLTSLRNLLLIDATTCTVMGLVLSLAAAPVAALTSLPPALLTGAGLVLLPIAALLVLVALRPALQAVGARLAVAGNLAWVFASFAFLISGWLQPNGLGIAFVLAQASAVAVLTLLELTALRRAARPLAA